MPNDTNSEFDVFVRDRLTGQTTRANVTNAGNETALGVGCPISISDDGRYVAFSTQDGSLDANDDNGAWDVYVRDRQLGTTLAASVSTGGAFVAAADGGTFPAISGNGRYVTWMTINAHQLVEGTPNTGLYHVLVRDLQTAQTTLVSRSSEDVAGDGLNWFPAISADGRYVAFYSGSSNLVAEDDGVFSDAFVHDRQTGETTRVSISSTDVAGNGTTGDSAQSNPMLSISGDGRYVAFLSSASNLVPLDTNNAQDLFVRDRALGRTHRASVRADESQAAKCGSTGFIAYPVLISGGGDVVFRSTHHLLEGPLCSNGQLAYVKRVFPAAPGDVSGDRRADLTVFRPTNGVWYSLDRDQSTWIAHAWGIGTDVAVSADYDGDRKADFAVYRPASGTWYLRHSWTGFTSFTARTWGVGSDIPVPADYDRDGKADLAIYRPSSGSWYILKSSTAFASALVLKFGTGSDIPVPGDYDGDRQADLAVYRPSSGAWFVLLSTSGYTTTFVRQFGISTDKPVPSDYDGDGRTDLAVYRPTIGVWYVLNSSSNNTTTSATAWGLPSDTPVPGDYNGDGMTDIAVFRPSQGAWYVRGQFVAAWGTAGDVPVLKR